MPGGAERALRHGGRRVRHPERHGCGRAVGRLGWRTCPSLRSGLSLDLRIHRLDRHGGRHGPKIKPPTAPAVADTATDFASSALLHWASELPATYRSHR